MKTLKNIWVIGIPLSLTFVIEMLMIMVDSAFAGSLNYVSLAAVSLVAGAFYILLLIPIGLGIGSSVRAGQADGAGNQEAVINSLRQGFFLCFFFGIVAGIVLFNISPFLLYIGQDQEVVTTASPYLTWIAWTLPIQALIVQARNYFAVTNKPWKTLFPVIWAFLMNAFLNYCLTEGNWGFPALGVSGIGISTFVSLTFLYLLMLWGIGLRTVRNLFNFLHPDMWKEKGIKKLLIMGIPISVTLVLEESFFSTTIFLTGTLGASEQAGHHILLNTIGMSYLFVLGIGIACSIIIGRNMGAGTFDRVMPTVRAGWILSLAFTSLLAAILFLFGNEWVSLFIDDLHKDNEATVYFARSVIPLAIIMLFIDVFWVIIIESLHGLSDTTYSAGSAIIAYWLIGIPLCIWVVKYTNNPFLSIWYVMLLSAGILTVLVYFRLRYKVSKCLSGSSYTEVVDSLKHG